MIETNLEKELFRKNVLSILVPVYNERAYLRKCIEKVMAVELPRELTKEIVIVDDASTDGTDKVVGELVDKYPETIRSFRQEVNQGKGAAIRRAINEMTGEYAIFQDADLEYDPEDYKIILQPILEGSADVVYGSRFASRTMRRVFNYHHALGNKFLTILSNLTTGLDLTDMETCYKAFRADLLKTIPFRSNRFGIEPEITAKISKRGCVVYEVPISYRGRGYAEGKKIGWKDGFQAISTILKYWVVDDCYNERYAESILSDIAAARRFLKWMVSSIEPFMGTRVVEISAGIGNISRFLPKKEKLLLTDIDDVYLQILNDAFSDNELVEVARLDLNEKKHFEDIGLKSYDTIVCLNVLEHIENDCRAVEHMKSLLIPGGRLILLVPQYPCLFGTYDKNAGHFRRYSRKQLVSTVTGAGMKVAWLKNFNFLPIFGWWVNACLLKRDQMGRWQLKIYDMLVPFLKIFEKLFPFLPGISLICVAEVDD